MCCFRERPPSLKESKPSSSPKKSDDLCMAPWRLVFSDIEFQSRKSKRCQRYRCTICKLNRLESGESDLAAEWLYLTVRRNAERNLNEEQVSFQHHVVSLCNTMNKLGVVGITLEGEYQRTSKRVCICFEFYADRH